MARRGRNKVEKQSKHLPSIPSSPRYRDNPRRVYYPAREDEPIWEMEPTQRVKQDVANTLWELHHPTARADESGLYGKHGVMSHEATKKIKRFLVRDKIIQEKKPRGK